MRSARLLGAALILFAVGAWALPPALAQAAAFLDCGGPCGAPVDAALAVLRALATVAAIAAAIGCATGRGRPAVWSALVLACSVVWVPAVAGIAVPASVATLAAFVAVPFLIVPPVGLGASRAARATWAVVLVLTGVMLVLDMTFSGFMMTEPAPPQLAFAVVLAAVLGAGLLGGALTREPRS